VLTHHLSAHVDMLAELAQCLAVVRTQPILQVPAMRVRDHLEHVIRVYTHASSVQSYSLLLGRFSNRRG
jgi:hypothetical protein